MLSCQLTSQTLLYSTFALVFQAQTLETFTITALTDSALEGEERFNVRLFPAQTDAIIDPLNGRFHFQE